MTCQKNFLRSHVKLVGADELTGSLESTKLRTSTSLDQILKVLTVITAVVPVIVTAGVPAVVLTMVPVVIPVIVFALVSVVVFAMVSAVVFAILHAIFLVLAKYINEHLYKITKLYIKSFFQGQGSRKDSWKS